MFIQSLLVGWLAALVATSGGLLLSLKRPLSAGILAVVNVGVFGLLLGVIIYAMVPALIGPTLNLGLEVCVLAVIACVVTAVVTDPNRYRDESNGALVAQVLVTLVLILYTIGSTIYSTSFFHASDMYAKAGEVEKREWAQDMAPVDGAHARMVSEEQAEWLGNKILGESDRAIGSKFSCGDYTIQRVNGHLQWVAPLEYNAFRHWQSGDGTVGYVVVSAEDRNERVHFVQDWTDEKGEKHPVRLRYLPSAFLGDYLKRHVYLNGHSRVLQDSWHFEIDDSGRPWWVIPTTRPTRGYTADELVDILLIDPETGKIDTYTPETAPAWVDHVHPEHLTYKYIAWWGEYEQGWWNAFWRKDNVVQPTTNALRMIWGADGEPYWFTGITSTSAKDDALMGFVLANSRTGKIVEYTLSGANEKAVLEVANSQVSNYAGWHATEPILYNLFGRLSWVIPVVSDKHIFQTLAIVDAQTSSVVLGEDKAKVLAEFRQKIAAINGNAVDPSTIAELARAVGIVARWSDDVVDGRSVYRIILSNDANRIFVGDSEGRDELPLTQAGDSVEIRFVDTGERMTAISTFDNTSIGLSAEAATN